MNMVYPVVCFGEILWDVLPTGAMPGGAPMNVAYHLQKLHLPPAVITRVGADERGRALLQLLKQNDITTQFIQEDVRHPTGMVLATLNERSEASYEIVKGAAWDFIDWQAGFKTIVASATYFIFGSLAARNKKSRDTLYQLLEVANIKVLDINLRPPHFTKATVRTLLEQCQILKINDQELQLIAGWHGRFKKLEDQMKLLQERFAIETVVTTRGCEGALVSTTGKMYSHPGFKVTVQDTIGSGDAFLAAFLSSLARNAKPAEALRFANSLGAFVASRSGAWPEYDMAQITAQAEAGVV